MKVAPERLAQRIARSIEDEVIAAGWPVGRLIGSEADLIARYGVSRGVLREAVRIVEHHQVAAMRRGPSGGLIVRAPDTGPAATALVVYLQFLGTSVEHLIEARLILEPLAFSLAAEQATDDEVEMLRRGLHHPNAFGSREEIAGVERCIHENVARFSRNVGLALFISVLLRLTERYARPPQDKTAAELAGTMEETHAAHEALVEALGARDGAAAHRRVIRHLEAMGGWLTEYGGGPITMTPAVSRALPQRGGKLGETLAGELIDDIVAAGWPVGQVFGSEAELLERYGVGRAALREAVRLLEHHSVARTRRGPGGGLVITEPDPAASIAAMALYLEYERVAAAELGVVRNVVEAACLQKVTQRVADPSVAFALQDAHRLDATSNNADLSAYADDLHLAIAELGGNPILTLFVRIVTTLSQRHNAGFLTEETRQRTGAARTVARAHDEIVEAVLAQDTELAQQRMANHLDATVALWLL